jgi:hypothetical protein
LALALPVAIAVIAQSTGWYSSYGMVFWGASVALGCGAGIVANVLGVMALRQSSNSWFWPLLAIFLGLTAFPWSFLCGLVATLGRGGW